jgi:putative membrane protein
MKTSMMVAMVASALVQPVMSAEMMLTPEMFVGRASEAGMAEVELSKVAVQKSTTPAVKEFAQTMVTDHTKANMELEPIAKAKSIAPTKTLNATHAKALADLKGMSGKDFDTAYLKQMVTDHDEAVALFTAGTTVKDKDLAAFATKTLPVLKMHQQHVQHLASMK